MTIEPEWLTAILTPVLTLVAAIGGIKTAISGLTSRMTGLSDKLDKHIVDDAKVQTRLLEAMSRVEEGAK